MALPTPPFGFPGSQRYDLSSSLASASANSADAWMQGIPPMAKERVRTYPLHVGDEPSPRPAHTLNEPGCRRDKGR